MALFVVEQPLLDAGKSMPPNLSGSSVMMGGRECRIAWTVIRSEWQPLGQPGRGDAKFSERCLNTGFDGENSCGQSRVAPASFTGSSGKRVRVECERRRRSCFASLWRARIEIDESVGIIK